jgi:hypothetical protein
MAGLWRAQVKGTAPMPSYSKCAARKRYGDITHLILSLTVAFMEKVNQKSWKYMSFKKKSIIFSTMIIFLFVSICLVIFVNGRGEVYCRTKSPDGNYVLTIYRCDGHYNTAIGDGGSGPALLVLSNRGGKEIRKSQVPNMSLACDFSWHQKTVFIYAIAEDWNLE